MKKALRLSLYALLLSEMFFCQSAVAQAPGVFSCGQSGPENDPCVIRFTQEGNIDTFLIEQPIVDKEFSFSYDPIRFFPGDTVLVEAGGCVQTGGAGDTWKRYVNPRGDGSDRLYFGSISISGVLPRTRFNQLPSTILIPVGRFVSTGMQLFYADDEYFDNGYWGHDNGNDNQCSLDNGADGGPAHVKITIVRAIPQSPPRRIPSEQGLEWDLVENLKPGDPGMYDDNGLFFNPRWRWQRPGSPEPLTFDRDKGALQSSQNVFEDNPQDSFFNYKSLLPGVCKDLIPFGQMHGHFNWFGVTVTGPVFWDHHDGSATGGDDDYNIKILTPVVQGGPQVNGRDLRAGVTSDNGGLLSVDTVPTDLQGEKAIKLEFDSDEVVDSGILDKTPWWHAFNDAVRSGHDPNRPFPRGPMFFDSDYPEARRMMDGHNAIVIGLMGLDAQHNGASEIHPVHGFAVQIDKSRVVNDDAWAIFVRNWGNEGECSKDQHFLNLRDIRIRLPRPSGISPTARAHVLTSTQFFGHNLGDERITKRTFEVHSQAGGDAIVIFHLPPATEDGGLIAGELHLGWFSAEGIGPIQQIQTAGGSSGSVPTRTNPPPINQVEEEDEEVALRRIWLGMTPVQRADYQNRLQALLPARGPSTVHELTPVLLNAPPPDAPLTAPSVATAPATRKIARDRARVLATCGAAADVLQSMGGDCSPLNELRIVNNLVSLTATAFQPTTPDARCPTGTVGKFSFNAILTTKSTAPPLYNFVFRVNTLTNGNLLVGDGGLPGGVGTNRTNVGTLDRPITPRDVVGTAIEICLRNSDRFTFLVDVLAKDFIP